MLGLVAIARSRVEPVQDISTGLESVLDHIDPARLIAAPDCGLGILDRATTLAKLRNMTTAARAF